MRDKHTSLIQLMCGKGTPPGMGNYHAKWVTSFESFLWGILLLYSHSGFTGTFQYNQVLWRPQWAQKAVCSLVHRTCLIQTLIPSSLIFGWLCCFACSRYSHQKQNLRNRYISIHPYFIVVNTIKTLHMSFTVHLSILMPHQFLLHKKIMCPKETKDYWAKSYKVRQCQNWSFPCNLLLVLVVLQPTLSKLSLGNLHPRVAQNLFIEELIQNFF